MRALVPVVLSFALVPWLACAPGDAEGDAGDAGGDGFDVFEPGMWKEGDTWRFTLVAADPSPPDPVNDNTWTVKVSDASNAPVSDLTVWLTPFMPDHDHGTSPPDFAGAPTENDGEYLIGPFALPMPGAWEFTLSAEDGEGSSDEVVFLFHIEG